MSMSNAIAVLTRLLREKWGLKVSTPQRQGFCYESTGLLGETPFFLYFYEPRFSKRIPVKVLHKKLDCLEALYTPQGLYYLADPEGDLSTEAGILYKKIVNTARLADAWEQ
ncbi:MAG: hypothetical protein LRS48_06280 [Desulfurococcales archaeon]|nr:hypothetical protein [Desulfurococcales archaeon]